MQNNNTKGMQLKRAVKSQSYLRLGISGPAGAGKTWTALEVASRLVPDARIAVLDTELGSASKYADHFTFDVIELDHYRPQGVLDFLHLCEREGYHVAIIDSVSPFWNGPGGFLEMVDDEVARQKASRQSGRGDSFTAWKPVDAAYAKWVIDILSSRVHVIFTLRAKMAYEQSKDGNGKAQVVKLGLAPVFRDTFPYELDVMLEMDQDHVGVVTKTRVHGLDETVHRKPGAPFAKRLVDWLSSGPPPRAPLTTEAPASDVAQAGGEAVASTGAANAKASSAAKATTSGAAETWADLEDGFRGALAGLQPPVTVEDLEAWRQAEGLPAVRTLRAEGLRALFADLRDGACPYWDWQHDRPDPRWAKEEARYKAAVEAIGLTIEAVQAWFRATDGKGAHQVGTDRRKALLDLVTARKAEGKDPLPPAARQGAAAK